MNVLKNCANYETFQKVAVDVFKTRNLEAIRPLKKFLTALPSPSYIRNVLIQAIYQLAEQEPETCRWIVRHRDRLEPELNLTEMAQRIATERLQSRGLILNRDFNFSLDSRELTFNWDFRSTAEGQIESISFIKAAILEDISAGDRLLIEEVFSIF